MLLMVCLKDDNSDVEILEDLDGFSYPESVNVVLRVLQFGKRYDDCEQLWLFEEFTPRWQVL
jgi:hypothetical protein